MSTATLTRPEAPATDERFRWAPLLVVLAGTFVTFLDFFIVNVALDSIGAQLHAGAGTVQLIVAGYALSFAVGMISGGRLGDLYGRRRMFSIGLALFTLMSLTCGLAPNAEVLVTARILQGAAGALLTPQVLAILSSVYPGRWLPRAFAGYGFAMGIAGVLGQLIGGALISADVLGGWRAIFLINVPVGVVILPLVRRVLPESRGGRARLDGLGTALITLTLTAVVLPLVEGRQYGWPLWSWLSFAAAPVLLAAFVGHQRRRDLAGRAPLVHLGLFADGRFRIGSLAGLTFGLVPAAFFFVLALYLQAGRGFSPVFSGVVFTAVGVGYFLAMVLAAGVEARLGRQVLALGSLAVGLGCVLLAVAPSAGPSAELVPGLALIGFGIGLVLVPLSQTVLADVEPAHVGAAAGVLATAQQVGGGLGVAVIGVVFFDAAGRGLVHAFTVSLWVLAALTLGTAALVQALPRKGR
ncbi:MAG TPA: MFS transporter [Jatrophihabitantaceae bacterium]|jgi:EmrB/QacA subfamily drug resistance transporter|nr:MFS transporter [Jatrophihabitantaceae bacterium]